jgi:hypothetical protein
MAEIPSTISTKRVFFMFHTSHVSRKALALLVFAAMIAPTANASPLDVMFHLHPRSTQAQDTRVDLEIYNKGYVFQDVKVAGKVYTVLPHSALKIKAPAGTEVYSESTGFGHHKGDLLFAVTPGMKGATISID